MNSVVCPHCKKSFEISNAIKHEMEEKILQDEREKTTKKLQEQYDIIIKETKEDAKDKENRIKELLEKLTESVEERRALKKETEEAKLEMQKKLAEEEEKIRMDARKKVEEEQRLKMLEKDKQIQDAMKEVEEMKRKLQQGSQQTQGEVFELHFHDLLQNEFPNDKIMEIKKGTRGGDILQEVWDRNGNYCGKILWELKNTKTWSEQWITKLKTDQREATADFAVIVSEVTPPGVDSAKFYNGVWITKQNFVVGLACSLRINVIQITMAKRASEGKKEKADILYSYLGGTEFRLRVEAIIEAFSNLQIEIEKEKRYYSNKWAREEKNIRQIIDSTYGMHGDLKGIMGNMLPQIKGLETLELGDGNEK